MSSTSRTRRRQTSAACSRTSSTSPRSARYPGHRIENNMISRNRTVSILAGTVIGATLLLVPSLAHAQPEPEVDADAAAPRLAPGFRFSLSVEPGLAMALTAPQAQRTDADFGQTLKLLFGVTPYLALGPTASFTTLPSAPSMATPGTAWSFGVGI